MNQPEPIHSLIARATPGTDAVEAQLIHADYFGWRRDLLKHARTLERELAEANSRALPPATLRVLVDALERFAHPDLSEQLGGNVEGDASPVFGRNKAVLTIGDFKRAQAALAALNGHATANGQGEGK